MDGGTVVYRGNGTLDVDSATAEVFVRGRSTSANANFFDNIRRAGTEVLSSCACQGIRYPKLVAILPIVCAHTQKFRCAYSQMDRHYFA